MNNEEKIFNPLIDDDIEDINEEVVSSGSLIEQEVQYIDAPETIEEETAIEEYDEKDNEIERKYNEIYDTAMEVFEEQVISSKQMEGRFRARNMEIAVQFLNAALNAAKEQANVKMNKDKLKVKREGNKTNITNNNLVIADRNEVLKKLIKG